MILLQLPVAALAAPLEMGLEALAFPLVVERAARLRVEPAIPLKAVSVVRLMVVVYAMAAP
jgi:hypothetical protein